MSRDLEWIRSLNWDVERREMVDDSIASNNEVVQKWKALATDFHEAVERSPNHLAQELTEVLDLAVTRIEEASKLINWLLPQAFARHKQLCVLEAKASAVPPAERQQILSLDRSLKSEIPKKTARYREIARRMNL